MEVQRDNQSKPEKLPDWLLDMSLDLCKSTNQFIGDSGSSKPPRKWHTSLKAQQVHYYKDDKHYRQKKCKFQDVEFIQNDGDSDSCKYCRNHLIFFFFV
jgi:hypothetical protein